MRPARFHQQRRCLIFPSPLNDLWYQTQLGCLYIIGTLALVALCLWLLARFFCWPGRSCC